MPDAALDRLDDILKKLKAVYSPVFVKGKEYPGNNPYIMNEINNMLMAGTLKQSDIKIDGEIVKYYDAETLLNRRLEDISEDIYKECDELFNKRDREDNA